MWRCLVEKNVRAGQVSNVGCGSEHGPVVTNNHKLEEKYEREYKGWRGEFSVVVLVWTCSCVL